MKHRIVTPGASLPRWPLGPWRAALEPVVRQTVTADNHDTWCLAMNNMALVELHRGNADQARKWCLDQIATLYAARNGELAGLPAGKYALQPLVNLVRLSGAGAGLFVALAAAARTGDAAVMPPIAPAAQCSFILSAIANDDRVLGYLDGLAATALARAALRDRDAARLDQARERAGGDLRAELDFIAHLWAREGAAVAVPSWPDSRGGDALTRLYHLLCDGVGLTDGDRAALALSGAGHALDAAHARRASDLLETAMDFIEEAGCRGAPLAAIRTLERRAEKVADLIGDEVSLYRILCFRWARFGRGFARLAALTRRSEYRAVAGRLPPPARSA